MFIHKYEKLSDNKLTCYKQTYCSSRCVYVGIEWDDFSILMPQHETIDNDLDSA